MFLLRSILFSNTFIQIIAVYISRKNIIIINIKVDKLGLNWAKLSSNWNWDLLHYINDYKLPLHVTEHNKSVTLVTSTYWHTSLLNCYLPCLLVYLLSYKPHYIEHQTVLQ